MKHRTWLGWLLLVVFVVSACAPAAIGDITGKSAMTLIYDKTYETVSFAWSLTGWLLGLSFAAALAILVYIKLESGKGAVGTFLFVGVSTIFLFGAFGKEWAKVDATHAVEVGAERAKTRKANQYKEKLHIPVTKTVLETRACAQRNNASSGCRYEWTYDWNYQTTCTTTTDDKGNSTTDCTTTHDTMHVPHFTEEWRANAYFAMPDEYLLNKVGEDSGTGLQKSEVANNPVRYYTDWQAPENYDAYWFGGERPNGFDYVIPDEWKAMDASLKAGRPYIITAWHDYVNWVFVTADSNNLVTISSQVEKYLSAGLLPQVNMIYSRFGTANAAFAADYDFVQFAGGLQPADYYAWQDAASLYSLNVGPGLQGSMVIWFVPANTVDNPDAWIQAAKAYLSQKEQWDFYMAPKNLILIGCGVDTPTNTISFCRMETGMPSGNIDIRYMIDHVSGVPFTPQGVFGTMNPTAVADANGFYASKMDVPADGMLSALFAPEPNGFKRVKMASLDWLKTDIKLDKPDIEWAVSTESASARSISGWLNLIGLLLAFGIGLATFGLKTNSSR
ncbi:MAG: hypothetical protein AAB548_02730 [Patescibacteria group bacterium]